jgi:hypothetical protein
MVIHICDPSTWEAEEGGWQVWGQPDLQSDTLSQKKKKAFTLMAYEVPIMSYTLWSHPCKDGHTAHLLCSFLSVVTALTSISVDTLTSPVCRWLTFFLDTWRLSLAPWPGTCSLAASVGVPSGYSPVSRGQGIIFSCFFCSFGERHWGLTSVTCSLAVSSSLFLLHGYWFHSKQRHPLF